FKSVALNFDRDAATIEHLTELLDNMGYNIRYYAAKNSSYDLPYDFYRPDQIKNRTQIELIQKNGEHIELSKASEVVATIAGKARGDERFYFPREVIKSDTLSDDLFADDQFEFQTIVTTLENTTSY
ncbi:MAG: hypothetical protein ACTH9Z_05795, partial [Bavariicoccus seileri]